MYSMIRNALKKGNLTSWMFFLGSLEGLVFSIYLLSIPADAKNAALAGYSLSRLALLLVMLALTGVFLWMGLRERKNTLLEQRLIRVIQPPGIYNKLILLLLLLFTLDLFVLLIPSYRFSVYEAHFVRVRPILLWDLLLCLKAVILLAGLRKPWQAIQPEGDLTGRRMTIRLVLLAALMAITLWVFIFISRLGVTPDQYYWNEAGVPLLVWQVVLALLLTFLFHRTGRVLGVFPADTRPAADGRATLRAHLPDALVFLLLWLVAALLWMRTPQQPHPWAPGSHPPNHAYYPISDSLDYYVNAEFAVLGQKLGNGGLSDKPLYSILLFLLQLATRGDFNRLVNWHVVVMASYPALLYLLGRLLHSRKAGLLLAFLAIFYEVNSISSTAIVNIPTPKGLLSEELARIGLVLLAILLVVAFKSRRVPLAYLIAAGGVFGWNTLMRYNTWSVLPLLVLLVYFAGRQLTKMQRLLLPAVFLIGCLVGLSGWMAREGITHSNTFFFLSRFSSTVLVGRYDGSALSHANEGSPPPTPVSGAADTEPGGTTLPEGQENLQASSTPGRAWLSLPVAMSNHFLHNLASSVVSLPLSLKTVRLYTTIKQTVVYSIDWRGELQPGEIVISVVNLVLVSIGVSAGWRRRRWAGMLPLVIFIGYHAGNAAALTSGNRYVTPVLWCLLLYYAAGLLEVVNWLSKYAFLRDRSGYADLCSAIAEPPAAPAQKLKPAAALFTLLGLLLVSGGFSFIDFVIPGSPRYAQAAQDVLASEAFSRSGLTETVKQAEIDAFLAQPEARLLAGEALFPRFYEANQGEMLYDVDSSRFFIPQDYSRLIITLLGRHGSKGVILPLPQPPEIFPHTADAIVLGCQREAYVEASLIVISLDASEDGEQNAAYYREPFTLPDCSQ